MSFLLASFLAWRVLLDMGSSAAFFTFLSQRPRSAKFVRCYFGFLLLQLALPLVIVGLALPTKWLQVLWPGEARIVVVLALIACFMQQGLWTVASQMAEAHRETVRVQRLNAAIVIVHFAAAAALAALRKLSVATMLALMALEWAIGGWRAMRLYRAEPDQGARGSQDSLASVWREFYAYCLPFVPYAALSSVNDLGDRWMLQRWGGASEQAYYAVAQQFSVIALLATSSVLRIFWKEIAEAEYRGDRPRVAALYAKVSRALYVTGAVAAGAVVPWAKEILELTLGHEYASGSAALILMFLYPIHQSMGQICATMLYATGRTREQVKLGLATMGISMIVTYLLLAPGDALVPGLGLASRGLALKMVVTQLFGVNLSAYVISRIFGWAFDWRYQVVGLAAPVAAGCAVRVIVDSVLHASAVVRMVSSAPVYLAIVALILVAWPTIAGVRREELRALMHRWTSGHRS